VAGLIADTLAPRSASLAGGTSHSRLDWAAVLRMMLQARFQGDGYRQNWLALCLCTICAGLAVFTVHGDASKLDVSEIRNVLLEALNDDCMYQDEQQSAFVLKVVSAASMEMESLGSCGNSSKKVTALPAVAQPIMHVAISKKVFVPVHMCNDPQEQTIVAVRYLSPDTGSSNIGAAAAVACGLQHRDQRCVDATLLLMECSEKGLLVHKLPT
jgi:hypothetical protein